MTDRKNGLPFDHVKITWEEIENAEADELGVGKNAQGNKLLRFLILNGGFDKLTGLKSIAHALYEDAEPEVQNPLKTLKEPGRRTKGMNRLENVLRGHSNFAPREAEVFHKALRASACSAWADLITADELVTLTPADLSTRAIAAGLDWPDTELSPALALEALALVLADDGLTVTPAFTDSDRLGVTEGSSNADLIPIDVPPSYASSEAYHLHVAGMKPGEEQVLLIEISSDTLAFEGGNAAYQGFPIAQHRIETPRLSQKSSDGQPFRIAEIPGEFAFLAITMPTEWDVDAMFPVDMAEERWSDDETRAFALSLRRAAQRSPGQIRIARHAYRVAG